MLSDKKLKGKNRENNKHAYLIMAHGNFKILKVLLGLIDDPRNDIYLHIDAKVTSIPTDDLKNVCKRATVYFTPKRINVKWGGYSQVRTEMLLFRTAAPQKYRYYHLLSGVDLPLRCQDEIHDFFDGADKEFIFYFDEYTRWDYLRLAWYRFPKNWNRFLVAYLNRAQEKMNIDRIKKYNMEFVRGYNWCSLTHNSVVYLLSKEKLIFKMCRATVCADECYKQIVLFNSVFRDSIYKDEEGRPSDLREVDWTRRVKDSPHVYEMDDYELLVKSHNIFARKFDEGIDIDIVYAIRDYVRNRSKNYESRYRNNI